MKYLILMCFCLVFLNEKCYSQIILKVDSANIENARYATRAILGEKNKSENFLLINIAGRTLLVVREGSKYRLYKFFNYTNSAMKLKVVDSLSITKDLILDKCFRETICSPRFYYMGDISQLTKSVNFETTYIYFILQMADNKKCEFNFPIRGQEVLGKFPLSNKIFKHLVKLMDLSSPSWKKK